MALIVCDSWQNQSSCLAFAPGRVQSHLRRIPSPPELELELAGGGRGAGVSGREFRRHSEAREVTKYFMAPLLHLFLNRAKHGDEEEPTVAIPPLLQCFTPPSPDRQAPVPMPPRHPVCIPTTRSLSLESLMAPLSVPLWRPGWRGEC